MNIIKSFVFIYLLSSSASATIRVNSNNYNNTDVFTINKGLSKVVNSFQVTNMPRVRSQDSFGICYACAASTLVQHKICMSDQSLASNEKCSQITPEQEVSQLHMVSKTTTLSSDDKIGDPESHKGLLIVPRPGQSIFKPSTINALKAISRQSKELFSEACLPFDKIVNKYGDSSAVAIIEQLNKIYEAFENKKFKNIEAVGICNECEIIKSVFGLNISNSVIRDSYKENYDNYDSFIYSIIFSSDKCKPLKNIPQIEYSYYPGLDEKVKKENLKELIKDRLLNKRINSPMSLTDLCLLKIKNKNLVSPSNPNCWSHELVISGYRTVCDSSGKNCKDEIKVHNCWGQEWQNNNNDGWVDADNLIKNIDPDNDLVESGKVSWIK